MTKPKPPKDLGPDISDRLREARKRAKLTQHKLAELTHSDLATVRAIESGAGGNLGVGLYCYLATVLGVRPAWLAFGDGPMTDLDDFYDEPSLDELAKATRLKALIKKSVRSAS